MTDKHITETLQKPFVDPDYIWSYEFIMKNSNLKDNKDGTISFSRPIPFSSEPVNDW